MLPESVHTFGASLHILTKIVHVSLSAQQFYDFLEFGDGREGRFRALVFSLDLWYLNYDL